MAAPLNLLADLPDTSAGEAFSALLERPGIRIERIVSRGHATPEDQPYVQAHAEWVMLLAGAARLWLEGCGERSLGAGDALLIPAGVAHRVTWTQTEPDTVWLAVHLPTDD